MNTHTNSSTQMTINDLQFPIFSGAIKAVWVNTAKEKGFNFVARIVDRMHFALECQLCGHINKVRLFTLTSAQPLCEGCCQRQSKSEPKGSAKCCHFGFMITSA